MKKILVLALLLSYAVSPAGFAAKQKPSAIDMTNIHRVFLGWVEISSDNYHEQGYRNREEWLNVIGEANRNFSKNCQELKGLAGRTVTVAKDKDDVSTSGNDLYIKFTDAQVDRKYRLHVAVHFIDLKTNAEIGSVPLEVYKAHFCGLVGCIDKELEEVRQNIGKQLGGDTAPEKK